MFEIAALTAAAPHFGIPCLPCFYVEPATTTAAYATATATSAQPWWWWWWAYPCCYPAGAGVAPWFCVCHVIGCAALAGYEGEEHDCVVEKEDQLKKLELLTEEDERRPSLLDCDEEEEDDEQS